MAVRVDETWHRLRDWTAGQTPSEYLAAQVLHAEGYRDIDPSHPHGGRDGGSDAMLTKNGRTWIMAVYFPQGEVPFKEVKGKVIGDYAGVAANAADGMAFVTNQHLTRGERTTIAAKVDGPLHIFHLERVVHILDRPAMAGLREQYLDIPANEAGLRAQERLQELARASNARCVDRWMGVGLPRVEAEYLAESSIGTPGDDLVPTQADRVVVWTAEMGSGKSVSAERVHQRAIAAARASAAAPIPVFLHATDATAGLEAAARAQAAEVGEPRLRGAEVIVDAIDEAGLATAERLLRHARVLAGTWPNTTVLLTSRPASALVEAEEHRTLPMLDTTEIQSCLELGAGREIRPGWVDGLTSEVRAVLRRPFFALLAGLWLRDNEAVPRAPVDLLAQIGRRATTRGTDEAMLRALAARSVARNLAPLPVAEAGSATTVESLALSGLVTHRPDGLVFALPALAQWFAAQSLLEGETQSSALLDAPEDLELWRDPLALAIALGSWQQSKACLDPLFERVPGFAFRVLDMAFAQSVTFGNPAPPWREAGAQTREALQILLNATGAARGVVSFADANGRLLPMAVATREDTVEVAYWTGEAHRPDIFAWPEGLWLFDESWDWGTMNMTRVGPTATWAWQWARDSFRDEVRRKLRDRSLPIPGEGPLADEAVWAFACEQLRANRLRTEQLPIQGLIDAIEAAIETTEADDRLTMGFAGGGVYDAFAIREYLWRRLDGGQRSLTAPLPPADQRQGGWIGEFYSPGRLIEIATELYRRVIVAYRQLVDRWLLPLGERLVHRVLMPLRVVGEVYPGDAKTHAFGPSLAGWIEALPEGAEEEVVVSLTDRHYDFQARRHSFAQQRAARPDAARWLAGTHGGLSFEVGARSPVAVAVYRWLAEDLQRIGLAQSGDANASAHEARRTVWDEAGN